MKFTKNFFKIIFILISFFISFPFGKTKIFASTPVVETEQDFSNLTTSELVEIIIDDEINYINFFSNINIGINKFKINNEYYNELTNRSDANNIIEELLNSDSLNAEEEYKIELLSCMINNDINSDNVQENLLYSYSNKNIYTPNGTIIDSAYYGENTLSNDDIIKYHNDVKKLFNTLTENDYVSPANNAYNCHSYAWYKQDCSQNSYWIDNPITYINDSSYIEVNDVRPGDIICYWAYGWNYLSGNLTIGYYISHSAIIVSGTINLNDNTTLSNLNLISKWGRCGVYTHDGNECPYGTEDSEFRYVKAYRPKTNNSYTLVNFSGIISDCLTVESNTQLINLYKMFELDVNYTKYYEFNIYANAALDVRLYDEHMQLIEILNLSNNLYKVHFIKRLINGKIYYLRVAYEDEDSVGSINAKIQSRNTTYLKKGENDILLNSYNNIKDYNFVSNKAGFYKFTLVGEKEDGTSVSIPSNTLKIYNDSNKTQLLQKFTLDGYINNASNKQNEDNMYVYLPRSGYFYLDVNFNSNELKLLKLLINDVTSSDLNLFDLEENNNESMDVMSETKKGDYFEVLNLKQVGMFNITFNYNGTQNSNILVLLTKQNYNETNNEYSIDTKVIALLNNDNQTYTYTTTIEEGMYYIGYFNKEDTSNIKLSLNRLVTQSGSYILVTDLDQATQCGSQINIIEANLENKSYRQSYITKGFTRLIYPNYNYQISPSRLDYYWYSSNNEIASITNYGTILGKSIGTVKIMAVLKENPSKVFVKEFTIINDTNSEIIELNCTYNVKYSSEVINGKFHFNINKINCPYPLLQYYTWRNTYCHNNLISASMDDSGHIAIESSGCFALTGIYNLNSNYRVVIHFVIE